MPELLLELFSEEIPARMQQRAAEDLGRLLTEALATLAPTAGRLLYGPRRIAWIGTVAAEVPAATTEERGPKLAAPEQAVAGFLRKHGATQDDLRQEGGYWLLTKRTAGRPAEALIAEAIPTLLRRFPWPKSMRWGGTSAFTWVRPLRRILCLLDGVVVPFDLVQGEDNGHGLASANETEGHRFLAPGGVAIAAGAEYESGLRARFVLADPAERQTRIAEGLAEVATAAGYGMVPDAGLLDEVTGLVEWPVPLLGRIDAEFMDLPPEVRQVSMRVNQRYFALTDAAGKPAAAFVFAANVAAPDDGAAIVAGNERVLRARLSDARHFWDLDRRDTLASRVPALDRVTFHAKLGNQGERARRLESLAKTIAPLIAADIVQAGRAGLLAKADLTSGMVGEFPELQGVMGRYYATHDGESAAVADAVRDHYGPRGPQDAVPTAKISVAVSLAEKIDILSGFFSIGERPSGSGDPYALRRAALGVIRVIRENHLNLGIRDLVHVALVPFGVTAGRQAQLRDEVLSFIVERLRVQLRSEGRRHDVLAAVFAIVADDDLTRLLKRADALEELLGAAEGPDLVAAYNRAANIVRIEDRKNPIPEGEVEEALFEQDEEKALFESLKETEAKVIRRLEVGDFFRAMAALSTLRAPVDAFFEAVIVNTDVPELRDNRLRLLKRLCGTMDRAADFSRLETTGAV
jgi:glycyl-tRNA synthetase beta chain